MSNLNKNQGEFNTFGGWTASAVTLLVVDASWHEIAAAEILVVGVGWAAAGSEVVKLGLAAKLVPITC